ncbi:MAG: methyltransferase domain-containing protein [Patescibacteria group bacterium]
MTRLPAFAENLSALPASSQDFVFATNVVGKSTLDVSKFHSELVRVLSPKGKAFILDYDDPSAATNSKELESLLRKTRVTNSFTDGWHRIVIS